MEKVTVAVIGAGPAGLSMLKCLREDGFKVTLFERRDRVGGLWAYSTIPTYTSALRCTKANISKYTCGFSDYPMPDKYPMYLMQEHFQEFIGDYARNFDLLKDIVFNTTVHRVTRNEQDTRWRIETETSGQKDSAEFDKVVLCHGYQTKAIEPRFEGQDQFKGSIMHMQEYRNPEPFKNKRVVVLGLGSSTGDLIPNIMPHASKVYLSHRRGAVPFKRLRNGVPNDLNITWRRRQLSQAIQKHSPYLHRTIADLGIKLIGRRLFGNLDPAWRLEPFPSVTLSLPGSWEDVIPYLQSGELTSLHGIKRFVGPSSIEFGDGTVLHDIDAVVLCTGYTADWSVAPFLETSSPTAHGYSGRPIYRMYMNMFPPAYADSCALLCYSAFGKNNGFSFADVSSWAVSNVFRGVEKLPSQQEMERKIDDHQAWLASRWKLDHQADPSTVKQWEFQQWLHRVAGTGMENLGCGWKGWKFWWKDRKMYGLMNNGVETAHMFRYFETGRRRTWSGAKEAILHINGVVETLLKTPQKTE